MAARRRRENSAGSTAPAGTTTTPAASTKTTTTRLKLLVRYDGTNFAGFQFQTPGVRTVQGELEKALSRVVPLRGRVVGAGRTDGGAHALQMCCHVDVDGIGGEEEDAAALDLAALHLNGHLPADVKVLSLRRAPLGVPRAAATTAGEGDDEDEEEGDPPPPPTPGSSPFDAQACSVGKEYHYLLSVSPRPDPLDEGARRWWAYDTFSAATRGRPSSVESFSEFDVSAARAALSAIAGTPRDFTALSDAKRPSGLGAAKRKRPRLARLAERGLLGPKPERSAARNTRTLWRAELEDQGGGRFRVVLAGDGFLYHQVRVTAAAVLEIGQRRLTVDGFLEGLEARDRAFGRVHGPPFEAAPPNGLYLARVFYPGDDLSL
jgi:tRNA pseudouridine38-40 synthase